MSTPHDKSGQPSNGPASSLQNVPGTTVPDESTPQSTTENVVADVTMDPGDSAGNGNDPSAAVSNTARLSEIPAELQQEVQILRLELERTQAELRLAQVQRSIAEAEAASARSMMNDMKDASGEIKGRLDELRDDVSRYKRQRNDLERRYDEAKENWRLKCHEFEDEIDTLRYELYMQGTQTQERRSTGSAPYDQDDPMEYNSMYGDDPAGSISSGNQPGSTMMSTPPITSSNTVVSATVPAIAPATAPTHTSAVGTTSSQSNTPTNRSDAHSYSGVTRGTSAFQGNPQPTNRVGQTNTRGPRPFDGGPPVKFNNTDKMSGTVSSRWADSEPSQGESLKRRSTGDFGPARGRHTPRGGTGFSRGRGNSRVSATRRAAKAATSDDIEWTGRHTINNTDPEGAAAWRQLDAPSALALFQGANVTTLDPTIHARQRMLVRHARMVPRDRLSAVQQQVVQLAYHLEQMGNHPLAPVSQIPMGVRFGVDGTYSSVDMAVHRFLSSIRPENRGEDMLAILHRINRVVAEIFSRPDTYSRLVESIAPEVSDNIYSDPLDQTVLTASTRLNPSTFENAMAVTHRSVAQWLWTTIRLPRSIARHVIEPYFRRSQWHSIAVRELSRLQHTPGVPDSVVEWTQRAITQAHQIARTSFVVRTNARYAIRDLNRSVWNDPSRTNWRWTIPPRLTQTAVPLTVAQILQEDASFNEVDLDVNWIPENVRSYFLPMYLAAYTAWEQEDLSAHEVPAGDATGTTGEADFNQPDTVDSA